MRSLKLFVFVVAAISVATAHVSAAEPGTKAFEEETLKHFQNILRMNTTDPATGDFDPPGGEKPVADYLVKVLKAEGIEVKTFAKEAHRPNVVARLKGSGKKRPLLLMAHTDTVAVDPAKWDHPPFSAVREDGWIYGRGAMDDKDNVTASLMTMLTLKRLNVPLDRDVIFLAEAGEEGSMHVGIEFMIAEHFDEIDAEFCYAEGGRARLKGGKILGLGIQTVEKLPRPILLTAKGVAGHGSIPLQSNAIVRLSEAVAAVAKYQVPIKLNETTIATFEYLAETSKPEAAARYRAILNQGTKEAEEAFEYFLANEPALASALHTSISPNVIEGGTGARFNVISSGATATLDMRVIPGDDPEAILDSLREVIDDPAITVGWYPFPIRPGAVSRLNTEAYNALATSMKNHFGEDIPVLPAMSTGATDMSYLRGNGIECYGTDIAVDVDDIAAGYIAHSDQERIIEAELYRFAHTYYDAVLEVVAAE